MGELPEALNGEFARNGPNPRFKPKAGYHWFDGDGMVSLTFLQFHLARHPTLVEESTEARCNRLVVIDARLLLCLGERQYVANIFITVLLRFSRILQRRNISGHQ